MEIKAFTESTPSSKVQNDTKIERRRWRMYHEISKSVTNKLKLEQEEI
jgi:hypothetical protein